MYTTLSTLSVARLLRLAGIMEVLGKRKRSDVCRTDSPSFRITCGPRHYVLHNWLPERKDYVVIPGSIGVAGTCPSAITNGVRPYFRHIRSILLSELLGLEHLPPPLWNVVANYTPVVGDSFMQELAFAGSELYAHCHGVETKPLQWELRTFAHFCAIDL